MAWTQRTVPIAFSNAQEALAIGAGHFPTEFLLALNGRTRQPCGYAADSVALKAILEENEFGNGAKDKLYLWLPQPEPSADMNDLS